MKKLFLYRTHFFFFILTGFLFLSGAQHVYGYQAPIHCEGPYPIGQKFDASPGPTPKSGQFSCAIGSATGDTPVPSSSNFYRCEETSANQLYCRHYINSTTDYYTCTYYGTGAHIGSSTYQRVIFDGCTLSLIPPSISFTAPASIILGQPATLSWNVTNATTCTASGGWSGTKALTSAEDVTPIVTTTYTLSCTGASILSQSRTVVVTIPDTTPPSNPSNLVATAISSQQINLTWTASTDSGSGLAGYHIERCEGATCTSFAWIADTTTASFSNASLTPSTTYRYRVRAYDNNANNSGYSNISSATTPAPPDTTPPTAFTLSGSALSSTQIQLTWTASTDLETGVANYRVYRDGTLIYTTLNAAVLTYTDSGLSPTIAYTYRVDAVNGGGAVTQSNPLTITTPAIPDTMPPVFIPNSPGSMLSAGTTSATFGGTTNENATCRYSTTSGLAFTAMTLFSSDLSSPTISHTQLITGLTDGTMYTYYVKCRDTASTPNTNATDIPYMFQVDSPAPDITPPVISGGTPSGTLPADTATATMSVVTDDDAYCRYNQNSDIAFDLMTNNLTSSDFKNHSVSLTSLTNGSAYTYYVRCENTPGGYANTSGYPISFVVSFPANMNPMALIVITPSTSGTAPFAISANGSGSYDSDGTITQYTWNWGDGSASATGVGPLSHTYATGGSYNLSLKVVDNQGGSHTAYQMITVSAAPPPPPPSVSVCTADCTDNSDCTAPNICGPSKFCIAQSSLVGPTRSDFYISRTDGSMSQPTPATFPAGTASVIMSMQTDVNAECQYSTVGGTLYDASAMKTFTNTSMLAHSVTLTGLASKAASSHIYYVRCRDLATGIVNDDDREISFIIGAPLIVSGPGDYTCLINADYVRSNVPYIFNICVPR